MSASRRFSGNKDQKLNDNPISDIIKIVLLLIIVIPTILVLVKYYYHFQRLAFSNDNSLIFIYDNKSLMALVATPIILLYLILIIIKNKGSVKNKIYIRIILITLFISTTFLSYDFFRYIDVNSNGIDMSNGLSLEKKHYEWEAVENVKVFYNNGYKRHIDIYYNIVLNDGSVINVYNSQEFFSKIILLDTFIQKNKITIIRSKILSEDKERFEDIFEGEGSTSVNRLDVLKKIFIE